jgi:hypothetical protein
MLAYHAQPQSRLRLTASTVSRLAMQLRRGGFRASCHRAVPRTVDAVGQPVAASPPRMRPVHLVQGYILTVPCRSHAEAAPFNLTLRAEPVSLCIALCASRGQPPPPFVQRAALIWPTFQSTAVRSRTRCLMQAKHWQLPPPRDRRPVEHRPSLAATAPHAVVPPRHATDAVYCVLYCRCRMVDATP